MSFGRVINDLDVDRNGALVRVLRLALRLADTERRPPLKELADEFRVCERTIRRDLRALQAAAWPVPSKWTEGFYYTDDGRKQHLPKAHHPWRTQRAVAPRPEARP
jgi:hypothetical protein